jgi:deazaflavin-dependent oxidoreductase (nitroreductase family)
MVMLRSPLHRALSGSLLVLSYEGRRSGRRYELPLQYVRHDDGVAVWAGNAEAKTWWRNFTEPAAVEVVLEGRSRHGKAHLVADPADRTLLLTHYLERFPATTPDAKPKFFGARWKPGEEEIAAVAADAVFVAIDTE